MIVDIGGGRRGCNSVNLDPIHGVGGWRRFAQDVPWPTGDETVTAVRASHSLEHIPAGADRLAVFNEAHRVLKRGGQFHIEVPLIGWTDKNGDGHQVESWHPWADPTHVSFWWFPESLLYFTGKRAAAADYGLKLWQLTSWRVRQGWIGEAVLTK